MSPASLVVSVFQCRGGFGLEKLGHERLDVFEELVFGLGCEGLYFGADAVLGFRGAFLLVLGYAPFESIDTIVTHLRRGLLMALTLSAHGGHESRRVDVEMLTQALD